MTRVAAVAVYGGWHHKAGQLHESCWPSWGSGSHLIAPIAYGGTTRPQAVAADTLERATRAENRSTRSWLEMIQLPFHTA